MKARLAEAEKTLGNIELVIGQSNNAEQTAAVLKEAGPGTPVLAINLNCFALTRLVQPVLDANHPMIVFSLPASGHDWMYPHRWQRQGHPVTLFPTSDLNELERALRLLRVIPMMQQTRILLFPPARGTAPAQSPEEVKKRLGADVVAVDEKTFSDLIAGADEKAVAAEAERWTKGAKAIIEPNQEDIAKAARVSIALQDLMKQQHAQGLAIGTCMGWLSKGFPCLGFTRLRDSGFPAACEGDMDSLLTMLLFQYAADRPGFQGNATFDTSRNALWTAHCTAPLQMDGGRPAGALPAARPFRSGRQRRCAGGSVPRGRDHHAREVRQPGYDPLLHGQDHRGAGEVRACLPHSDRHRSPRRGEDGRQLEQRPADRGRHDAAAPRGRLRRPPGQHPPPGAADEPERRRGRREPAGLLVRRDQTTARMAGPEHG